MPRIGSRRHELLKDAALLALEALAVERPRRALAELRVTSGPRALADTMPIWPHHSSRRQRRAALLVDAPVRLELGSFAVEDDAVEVEDHRRENETRDLTVGVESEAALSASRLSGFYSARSAIIGSTPVARRAGM